MPRSAHAEFDFTRYVPVSPAGVISESPDIGAMLGMDMLEPSCTVPTSIGCPLGVAELDNELVPSLLEFSGAVQQHDGDVANGVRRDFL